MVFQNAALILARVASLLMVLVSASPAQQQCDGDFDRDGTVSIDELIRAVDNSLRGCMLVGPRFVDNGDGTISDNLTGLMWEKKVEGGDCLHCANDTHDWGFAMSDWLSALNGAFGGVPGLGGFDDWRVPSSRELLTILDCTFGVPCIDPTIGPSSTSCYWTSISDSNTPSDALTVDFGGSGLLSLGKGGRVHVRAVRSSFAR